MIRGHGTGCDIGATIRQFIYKYYTNYQQYIINLLRDSPGKIHTSFVGWTLFNQYTLYGIMCFFRKPDNTLCKLLLGVSETIRHFGNSIAGEVFKVLFAFGISSDKSAILFSTTLKITPPLWSLLGVN
jgi:hypothetical protein